MRHTRALLCTGFLVGAAGLAIALDPGTATSAPEDTPDTITVSASGDSSTAVTRFELRAKVAETGELAADALDAFRNARKRTAEGFGALGVEGLTVEGEGVSLSYGPPESQMMGMMMMGGDAPENVVTCQETILVSFPAGDVAEQAARIADVIDAALDLELQIGEDANMAQARMYGWVNHDEEPETMLTAIVDETPEGAQADAARRAALAEATRVATQVAEQAGRAVGDVTGIVVESVNRTWDGVGADKVTKARLRVTFELR